MEEDNLVKELYRVRKEKKKREKLKQAKLNSSKLIFDKEYEFLMDNTNQKFIRFQMLRLKIISISNDIGYTLE